MTRGNGSWFESSKGGPLPLCAAPHPHDPLFRREAVRPNCDEGVYCRQPKVRQGLAVLYQDGRKTAPKHAGQERQQVEPPPTAAKRQQARRTRRRMSRRFPRSSRLPAPCPSCSRASCRSPICAPGARRLPPCRGFTTEFSSRAADTAAPAGSAGVVRTTTARYAATVAAPAASGRATGATTNHHTASVSGWNATHSNQKPGLNPSRLSCCPSSGA